MTSNPFETLPRAALTQSVIISYGEGHHDDPPGDALNVDTRVLRNPPDDPEVRERMLYATGLDPEVRAYVKATPGADDLINRTFRRAAILLARCQDGKRVDIHVRCGGGRHRSVVVAEELGRLLVDLGHGVEVEHRHIDRPILTTS